MIVRWKLVTKSIREKRTDVYLSFVGCEGNQNNFVKLEDCQAKCRTVRPVITIDGQPAAPTVGTAMVRSDNSKKDRKYGIEQTDNRVKRWCSSLLKEACLRHMQTAGGNWFLSGRSPAILLQWRPMWSFHLWRLCRQWKQLYVGWGLPENVRRSEGRGKRLGWQAKNKFKKYVYHLHFCMKCVWAIPMPNGKCRWYYFFPRFCFCHEQERILCVCRSPNKAAAWLPFNVSGTTSSRTFVENSSTEVQSVWN